MKKSQLTKIIKEEISSVIKEEEEFRSLLMELPDTSIDPSADVSAGNVQAAISAAKMYARTGDEKYRQQGEQAIRMSKDTTEGQGIITDFISMFIGAPAIAMGAKNAARRLRFAFATGKFRAGRKAAAVKSRLKDVADAGKVVAKMRTPQGRAVVKQAAKDITQKTIKSNRQLLQQMTSPKGAQELFDQMTWYFRGAKGVSPAAKSKKYKEIFRWNQMDPFFGGSSNPHAQEMIRLAKAQGQVMDDAGREFLNILNQATK